MNNCNLCPRKCGVDRINQKGACLAGNEITVSRVSKHMWEEPCISGTKGSGTVFFSGCSLKCVFCQNRELSCECIGEKISVKDLANIFINIQESGAHNVNLVTPTHFTPQIAEAIALVKKDLSIPIVWNSSGYELPETLELLDGLVDIYMPDFKYASDDIAVKYSGIRNYAENASSALKYMYSKIGGVVIGDEGLMKKGIIVRHLVLPGCRKDSIDVLHKIADILPIHNILLSLMAQYTPDFYDGDEKNLRRRVTTFEYESVRDEALRMGFDGYMQSPMSAVTGFTPEFTDKLTIEL